MNRKALLILIVTAAIFIIISVVLVIYFASIPKIPPTQTADKTVIIDNFSDYTTYISPESFGYLGNDLYRYIKDPTKSVYHASIVDGSYKYSPESWFSTFTVKLKDGDTSWNVSMQTTRKGEINGDTVITCRTSDACISLEDMFVKPTLQAYLPLSTDDYIIAYQKDNQDILSVVYYDKAGLGKEKALEKIWSLGFKPEDYTIKYFYGGH